MLPKVPRSDIFKVRDKQSKAKQKELHKINGFLSHSFSSGGVDAKADLYTPKTGN